MAEKITEESGIHKTWYLEAEKQTLETLPAFLDKLATAYEHDYGTICHAMSAGAVAVCRALNASPQGGITGFQASCVMWGFITNWMHKDGPMSLVEYEWLLYPQYKTRFTRISKDTFSWIQEKAKENLKNKTDAVPNVISHWEAIAAGHVPFGLTVEQ